ncbi:MAG: nucleoside triphosphate pyrophosphohydrolase [Kiritimatiellia bacterium]
MSEPLPSDEACRDRAPGTGLARLGRVVRRLRAPGGCPWDREQTLESLKPCLLEETYELLEAIDRGDLDHHAEELGDVLLQVVFQCDIRAGRGEFDLDEVAHRASDKLVRRHPHVFADVAVADSAEVLRNWESIKKTERRAATSALDAVAPTLPALLRAQQIQSRAARMGHPWPAAEAAADALRSQAESAATADADAIGDLLFTAVSLARARGINAEDALRKATDRFREDFNRSHPAPAT